MSHPACAEGLGKYIHWLHVDIGCNLEGLLGVMAHRDRWQETKCVYIYIYIYIVEE